MHENCKPDTDRVTNCTNLQSWHSLHIHLMRISKGLICISSIFGNLYIGLTHIPRPIDLQTMNKGYLTTLRNAICGSKFRYVTKPICKSCLILYPSSYTNTYICPPPPLFSSPTPAIYLSILHSAFQFWSSIIFCCVRDDIIALFGCYFFFIFKLPLFLDSILWQL